MLESLTRKIYIGGDSGYGEHFAEIGQRFGEVDLAILENGQYNAYWRHNHMFPEETIQAAVDIRAKILLPVHAGKFKISHHAWDEPFIRITNTPRPENLRLITPKIGEIVYLDEQTQTFTNWWENID